MVEMVQLNNSDMLVADRPITATYPSGEEVTATAEPTQGGLYVDFNKEVTINPGDRVKFTSGGVEKYLMFE